MNSKKDPKQSKALKKRKSFYYIPAVLLEFCKNFHSD